MAFTPFFLHQALQTLNAVTQAALYQNPNRTAATLTGDTSGVLQVTPSTAFPMVTGVATMIASTSLPAVLIGLSQVYIRPISGGQFYAYSTLADSLADTNRLIPAATFSGTVIDVDLSSQRSVNAVLAYECAFAGYARYTANYATGVTPESGSITRTAPYTLNNSTAAPQFVTHVAAYSTTNLVGVAQLASVATVPANATLVITTSVSAAST